MLDALTPKLVKMVFFGYIPLAIKGEFGQAINCLVGNSRQ
jgi:hypothetical protein